jgi:hypothetical protein
MTPCHDLYHGVNAGVFLAVLLIEVVFCLTLFCGVVCGELPEGMVLCNEVRVDTLIRFDRVMINRRWIDSVLRSDSVRQRQRLNRQDSLWLELR